MNCIYSIGQHFLEGCKVHGICVTIRKENVIGVNVADGFFDTIVPDLQVGVVRVGRFTEDVLLKALRMSLAVPILTSSDYNLQPKCYPCNAQRLLAIFEWHDLGGLKRYEQQLRSDIKSSSIPLYSHI
jgi:hypothetical protein